MITVTETAMINRSPGEVFDTLADPFTQLKWDPGTLKHVEKLTSEGLAKGARYKGNFKGFGTMEYEYADYDPPSKLTHHTRMLLGDMRHTFALEPVADGTRLTQTGRLQPNLLGRLLAPVFRAQLKKRFQLIASELQQYLASSR